jgi:hypothetical protein
VEPDATGVGTAAQRHIVSRGTCSCYSNRETAKITAIGHATLKEKQDVVNVYFKT